MKWHKKFKEVGRREKKVEAGIARSQDAEKEIGGQVKSFL